MLKEKIHYSDRLPLNVTVVDIEEYPIHFHDDLEIVFVMGGGIILKNGFYNYEMHTGDIFILNAREIHSFKTASDNSSNMVLMLQFDMEYFINHYPNLNNSFFVADMDDPDDEGLEVLQELLASAIMQVNSANLGYEQKLIEIAHNIIACLNENFQYFSIEDGRFVNESKKKSNKILAGRMNRVSDYLYENYSRKLTLQEIADSEHLSIYHLSHVIKQSTGLSFKELLGFIRVEESEKLLLGTDMSINAISEAVGFSATRYYIEHFKKWFDEDPATYRKENEGKVSSRKTPALLKKVNKQESGETIKKSYPDVYYDHHKKNQPPEQVLDINILTENTGKIADTLLYKTLSAPEMNHASQLLHMMACLNEPVVASGDNFIATSDRNASHISILIYNLDAPSSESDILVRVSNLTGKYNLRKVILSTENIKAQRIPEEKNKSGNYRREGLFRQLDAIPVVETSVVTAVNTLNLVLSLSGMSAELMLLDKIQS